MCVSLSHLRFFFLLFSRHHRPVFVRLCVCVRVRVRVRMSARVRIQERVHCVLYLFPWMHTSHTIPQLAQILTSVVYVFFLIFFL